MQKMTFCARLYLALGAVRGRQGPYHQNTHTHSNSNADHLVENFKGYKMRKCLEPQGFSLLTKIPEICTENISMDLISELGYKPSRDISELGYNIRIGIYALCQL